MQSPAPAEAGPCRKPTSGRFLALAVTLLTTLVVLTTWARAEDSPTAPGLTEAQAVKRALANPALARVTRGAVGLVRSAVVQEGLWPDPRISYSREQTFGPQGAAQDFVTVSQLLDLSGRRDLRTDAAERRARAEEHRRDAHLLRVEAETSMRFHELLAVLLRVAAIHDWVKQIEGALETVARREAAGDAAAYDRRRLEKEMANARGRLEVLQAARDRAWARLAVMIGGTGRSGGDPPPLSGALLPEPPRDIEQLVSRIGARPDILALDAHAGAARADGEAAGRWWVPGLELGAGWTGIDLGDERVDGYVLTATLSVPLFDRKQDELLRAESGALLHGGRRDLALLEARGEVLSRFSELGRLIGAARGYRRDAAGGSRALIRTAEAGYAGDELGILELLDAYRGAFEDEMTALDLEHAARRARIELDLAAGGHAR